MIRRPLNPVSRYQERLKRAVSANSMNKSATSGTTKLNPGKMPVVSSPAPRSPARQERPPADQLRNAKRNQRRGRKDTSSSLRDENINQFHAINRIADTFDMSAGVKSNPFLLMDRKKKAAAAAPQPPPPARKPLAAAPMARPIRELTVQQKAEVKKKRLSISNVPAVSMFRGSASAATSVQAAASVVIYDSTMLERAHENMEGPEQYRIADVPCSAQCADEEPGVQVAPVASPSTRGCTPAPFAELASIAAFEDSPADAGSVAKDDEDEGAIELAEATVPQKPVEPGAPSEAAVHARTRQEHVEHDAAPAAPALDEIIQKAEQDVPTRGVAVLVADEPAAPVVSVEDKALEERRRRVLARMAGLSKAEADALVPM